MSESMVPSLYTGFHTFSPPPCASSPDMYSHLVRSGISVGLDLLNLASGPNFMSPSSTEFEHALGGGEGQGSLGWYRPWDCRVRHK